MEQKGILLNGDYTAQPLTLILLISTKKQSLTGPVFFF